MMTFVAVGVAFLGGAFVGYWYRAWIAKRIADAQAVETRIQNTASAVEAAVKK